MGKRRSKNGGRGKRGGGAKGAPRPVAFKEKMNFDVPAACNHDDPVVNTMNRELADYYGSMATCRKNWHTLLVEERDGERNAGVDQAERNYGKMEDIAKGMIQLIRDRLGKPVPYPVHFKQPVKL